MTDWEQISAQLFDAVGISLRVGSARPVSGGCISSAYVVECTDKADSIFVKIHQAAGLTMFEAECDGLSDLAKSDGLRVPVPLHCGVSQKNAYLAMEYVLLNGEGSDVQLGEGLAAMHRTLSSVTPDTTAGDQPGGFGWYRDNAIGSTLQVNDWAADWVSFWAEQRLGYQLRLAAENGAGQAFVRRVEQLQAALPVFFVDYQPVASLLHGDLWSGNYAFDQSGRPVIFDPAVYYGDREADLAMTELFGGFSPRFYNAYNSAWPLDAGYATRKTLYNLYHILNHFNLFGGGYLSQAQGMVDRLLAEC